MLKYQFPAVKGCQAGKDYYICMVPLGLMSKIFATDSSDVPAEYRAQRKLNEARIPEICGYILSNRDSYVFSALAASVDGDMKFVPADSNENAGILEIDMTASFLINDGQHRKAAIEAAIAEDESLKEETISIVLYKDQGLQRSQQMFTDLNKHAVTTSKSLNTLYESKDPVALITKNVVNSISFLRKYTDKEKDNLSKYSSNIFTLNTFYTANKRICKVIHDQENAEKLNNCTIIFIDSKTRESAYKLFQVLNDRGAGLTEGDLLKSKTLEVLEKHFSIKQSTVQDAWDEILQDEPKQIEQFLRYYYASVCGSRVGRTSLYDDFLKQFFPDIVDVDDVSDEATATKIVDTVNQILREIRTYRKLIAGIWPYEVGQPLTDWDRKRLDILIRFLDFDIVYPLLLAAVQLKQKTFADLVHMLEKFMFRHKSVCNLGHQKLSELYMQEAVKIRRDPENYRLTGLRTTLKEYIETECTDAVFKVGLSNLKYRTNGGNKPLRYLFSTLNEHIEWYRNGAVGAPAPQKGTVINYDNVTIEHIASQSPSAAVPGFTSENIHTLSNLTLLTNGENDRAKNKSYTAKKAIYHDSEYVINKYFDSVDDWSVESAKAWEQYLQEMVCKVFVV